jgi:hypothetical protein
MFMMEAIKKDWRVQVLVVLFVLLSVWWVLSPQMISQYGENFIFQFSHTYFVIALWGVLCGLAYTRCTLKGTRLLVKAEIFFLLGLFGQVFGQIAYSYYVLVYGDVTPYPSVGDFGFFGTIPFYIIAVLYLLKANKIQVWLQSYEHKLQALLVPLVMLALAYGLFLYDYAFDLSQPMIIFLDFIFPIGQAVHISLAILIYVVARSISNRSMQNFALLILVAFIMQFFSDYTYSYEVNNSTWVPGNLNEYMYLVAYFFMSFGILRLQSVKLK